MVVFAARKVSPILGLFVVLALLVPAPAASAEGLQDFYLLPDMTLGLSPGEGMEVAVTPIVGSDTSIWRRPMQQAGEMLPDSGTIELRVKDANLALAAGGFEVCPLTIYVGIMDQRYVYWCRWIDGVGTGVALDGEYTVTFELTNPEIEPIAFDAGDEVYVWLVTTSSQVAVPSVYAMDGSFVRLSGTSEPMDASDPDEDPETTTTTSTDPSTSSSTTSSSPTSTSSSTTTAAAPSETPADPCAGGACLDGPVQEEASQNDAPPVPLALLAVTMAAAVAVLRRRL